MKRILVIDDQEAVRKTVVDVLKFAKFDAREAANGHEGVLVAREYQPDLIICDVMMPELDGYGTLVELRSHPETALIPFIFVTAKTAREDVRRGMDLGADDYITKPFKPQELLEAVRVRLQKHEAFVGVMQKQILDVRDYLNLTLPHELRTPLTSIIGYMDLLLQDHRTIHEDVVSGMMENVYRSALRLHRLTENYIAYAQIEALARDPGLIEQLQRYADCHYPERVIEAAAEIIAGETGRHDDLHISADVAHVRIMDENLKKIVEELVDNAFKFSDAGTPVQVTARANGSVYTIAVANSGRGMSPDQIASIDVNVQFERRKYEQRGVGLGLVIARRLVELYSGVFRIESVAEGETTIEVSLPLV
ncbi:MAG: hybrid sensor histidine kinase/response regulator [Anaerolineae bacterium]|nr:hybrid sensor histidine kinase/response regulator [Anaerolineae bacterium]